MIRHLKTARLQQGSQTDPAVTAAVEKLLGQVAEVACPHRVVRLHS
jgi:sulfopropanediol 3-dehydrogenase